VDQCANPVRCVAALSFALRTKNQPVEFYAGPLARESREAMIRRRGVVHCTSRSRTCATILMRARQRERYPFHLP
jgi:hypothetical protein